MGRRLVCLCNLVEESEIIKLLEKRADSTSHIQLLTRAGTSCGRCLPDIDQLVDGYQKKKPKDLQKSLTLGYK
jgi:bacterioferritin-associated ferredoxin